MHTIRSSSSWKIDTAIMNNLNNLTGKAGEYLCIAEFMRPVADRRLLFDVNYLGGDAPTFDYIVYLLDVQGDRSGPFFFVQVKTVSRLHKAGVAYQIKFSASDVKRAQATKVPFFVCVVDRSTSESEKFFIKGVDSQRTRGITRLQPVYDLKVDAVKLDLYYEVTRLWAKQKTPILTKLI